MSKSFLSTLERASTLNCQPLHVLSSKASTHRELTMKKALFLSIYLSIYLMQFFDSWRAA